MPPRSNAWHKTCKLQQHIANLNATLYQSPASLDCNNWEEISTQRKEGKCLVLTTLCDTGSVSFPCRCFRAARDAVKPRIKATFASSSSSGACQCCCCSNSAAAPAEAAAASKASRLPHTPEPKIPLLTCCTRVRPVRASQACHTLVIPPPAPPASCTVVSDGRLPSCPTCCCGSSLAVSLNPGLGLLASSNRNRMLRKCRPAALLTPISQVRLVL